MSLKSKENDDNSQLLFKLFQYQENEMPEMNFINGDITFNSVLTSYLEAEEELLAIWVWST